MTAPQILQHPKTLRIRSYASAVPSRIVEYTYYAVLFYTVVAPGLGILVPYAASVTLLVLAAVCVIRLKSLAPTIWATAVYAPIRLPLACVISYLVVQITVYGEPVMVARSFINWMLMLIIVQSLCLRREFLHRCALALFFIGCIALPYLIFKGSGMHERAVVDEMVAGAVRGSNGLGTWFGYCCIYFTIVGLGTKRIGIRVASWLTAVGCLYIVGLTVSRGALLATATGVTIAFRGPLKRGFLPLLAFITLGGIIFNLGVFDQMISHYATRGMEDTGRAAVWLLAIERFLNSPLLGVGGANVATHVPGRAHPFAPHNTFIYFALSSGVLPLVFFVTWWIRAAQNAFSYSERQTNSPFRLPFLVCTFWNVLFGDLGFMSPWGVVALCIAMAPNMLYRVHPLTVRSVGRGQAAQALDTPRHDVASA
jgi:hypothetical protein